MPRRRRFPSSTGVNRTGLVALRTSGASLGGSSRARPMSIGPDRWHSSHLRCVALFNVAFCFRHARGRVWRGAVQFITHPSQYPTLVCGGSLVGLCVRVPRTRKAFTEAQMQVALFARSRLVARWYSCLRASVMSRLPRRAARRLERHSVVPACVLALLVGAAVVRAIVCACTFVVRWHLCLW